MKLRNKKTGEIGYTAVLHSKAIIVMDENAIQLGSYTSLAELNSEWEDYEAPKEYWYIDCDGEILCGEPGVLTGEKWMVSIGNHFETREEAVKALQKLEAWKRVKDKGFRFGHWVTVREKKCGKVEFKCDDIRLTFDEAKIFYNDLTLLFGGEE